MPVLEGWQEVERNGQLKRDRAEYDRKIKEKYPDYMWEYQRKQAEGTVRANSVERRGGRA
jgi:hypothetical protein